MRVGRYLTSRGFGQPSGFLTSGSYVGGSENVGGKVVVVIMVVEGEMELVMMVYMVPEVVMVAQVEVMVMAVEMGDDQTGADTQN